MCILAQDKKEKSFAFDFFGEEKINYRTTTQFLYIQFIADFS